MGNARKALEEEDVGAFVTEAAPFASEPTVVPETVDKLDTSTDAYDFKEYDLKEYDLGEVDGRLYDYGAYDEYGTATPELTATDDEVGPGVAAETDISENTVSTTLTRVAAACSGVSCSMESLSLPVHVFLVLCPRFWRCWDEWKRLHVFLRLIPVTPVHLIPAVLHSHVVFPFSLHVFNLHASLSWLIWSRL